MTDIEEYKDLAANIRERHTTIWHVRNIYTIIMLALVGFTYQLKMDPLALRKATFMLALCVLAISYVVITIEMRYSKIRDTLITRLVELEGLFHFSQYKRLHDLRGKHPILFGRALQLIYGVLVITYVIAILARGFIV